MIEAVYLPPDFLENLVPNNFLYALSCGVIRVELLSKIPLEGSVPEVADTATRVADFGSSLRHGTVREAAQRVLRFRIWLGVFPVQRLHACVNALISRKPSK